MERRSRTNDLIDEMDSSYQSRSPKKRIDVVDELAAELDGLP